MHWVNKIWQISNKTSNYHLFPFVPFYTRMEMRPNDILEWDNIFMQKISFTSDSL